MSQLPVDCLNEIFQYLEKDKITLHSCLLVNRIWCQVSVRILWTSVWNYDTLITCLSKEILYKNRIITPTTTSKPLFNYMEFIKNLEIDDIIKNILKNYQSITPINLNYKKYIVAQEIYKLLDQISSLRELHIHSLTIRNIPNVTPTIYLRTGDCLKHLSKLSCRSDIYSQFFYQLSKICQNIQSLKIHFIGNIPNELTDLISAQKNLKYLDVSQIGCEDEGDDLAYMIPSLTKHSNTLIKLVLSNLNHVPLSFIAEFKNLQKIDLLLSNKNGFEDFKELQYYVNFPQLRVLKFSRKCPKIELLIKFLEVNGWNLNFLVVMIVII